MPRALGNFRGYTALKGKICSECNGRFSQLEALLLRSAPEAILRQIQRPLGRKQHAERNPFYTSNHGQEPVRVEGKLPGETHSLLFEVLPGGEGQILRQLVFVDAHDRCINVPLAREVDSKEELRRLLSHYSVEDLKLVGFFSDDEEDSETIQRFCEDYIGNRAIELRRRASNQIARVQARFDLPIEYYRALAKIAFHFFLVQFSHLTGLEPEFDGIKRFIYLGGAPHDHVETTLDQIVPDVDRLKTCAHFLSAERGDDRFTVRLQLFAGFKPGMAIQAGSDDCVHFVTDTETRPLVWVVRLGRNPSSVFFREKRGLAFVYYGDRKNGYDGEISKLMQIRSVLPVSAASPLTSLRRRMG